MSFNPLSFAKQVFQRDVVRPAQHLINPNVGLPQRVAPIAPNTYTQDLNQVTQHPHNYVWQGNTAVLKPAPSIASRIGHSSAIQTFLHGSSNGIQTQIPLINGHFSVNGPQLEQLARHQKEYVDVTGKRMDFLPRAGKSAPTGLNTRTAFGLVSPEKRYSSEETRAGGGLVRQATKDFGFTPMFYKAVQGGNPAAVKDNSYGHDAGFTNGATAAGEYDPAELLTTSPITIGSKYTKFPLNSDEIIHHEGLHRVFQSNKKAQQAFLRAYQKSATPDLKKYLAMRLTGYPAYEHQKGGVNDLANANFSTQTETHSYIPGYYYYSQQQMPAPLQQYYSQFYNTQAPRNKANQLIERYRVMRQAQAMLGELPPRDESEDN